MQNLQTNNISELISCVFQITQTVVCDICKTIKNQQNQPPTVGNINIIILCDFFEKIKSTIKPNKIKNKKNNNNNEAKIKKIILNKQQAEMLSNNNDICNMLPAVLDVLRVILKYIIDNHVEKEEFLCTHHPKINLSNQTGPFIKYVKNNNPIDGILCSENTDLSHYYDFSTQIPTQTKVFRILNTSLDTAYVYQKINNRCKIIESVFGTNTFEKYKKIVDNMFTYYEPGLDLYASCDKNTEIGLNKQVYFPIQKNTQENSIEYHLLLPVHNSALMNKLYKQITSDLFSDEASEARKKYWEWKNNKEVEIGTLPLVYNAYPNLTDIRHGGSNSQNISISINKQGGKSYLLPTLPPALNKNFTTKIIHGTILNFFIKMNYIEINLIFERIKLTLYDLLSNKEKINRKIKEEFQNCGDELAELLILFANNIRESLEPGWSEKRNKLTNTEYILFDNEGYGKFKNKEISLDSEEFSSYFAFFINKNLQKTIKQPKLKLLINDKTYNFWKYAIDNKINFI